MDSLNRSGGLGLGIQFAIGVLNRVVVDGFAA